ncbi:MAG: primosomal protein N' [Bacteroidales bacterium]|nr:primosomal protein N' [Bacteroidales bacterium]
MPRSNASYADLILPLAVPQYYTYEVPEELQAEISPGCRVIVMLGNRHYYTGIVRNLHNNPPIGYEVKPIISLLETIPLISEGQMEFWEWVANYYMCTVGEVYRAAVPSGLKLESETTVFLAGVHGEPRLSPAENELVDILEKSEGISIRQLAQLSGKKNVLPHLNSLIDKGIVSLEENLRELYKARTRDYVVLQASFQDEEMLKDMLDKLERRAPKQAELLMCLFQLTGHAEQPAEKPVPVSKPQLLATAGATTATLKSLVDKKVVSVQTVEISRLANVEQTSAKPWALNEKQTTAYLHILDDFKTRDVTLLHGITSSGKTEVYIHLIEHYLRQEKQVLYLLPEIALTTQIIQRLQRIFGNQVGVYHSRFSDAERVEVYHNLRGIIKKDSPSFKIILGVRSSVFLPFENLGLIIVDEEHENTYKQFDPAPRYNARDAAIVLAGMQGAKVLLGTATPSFESYLNALNGRYGLVELLERYREIELPAVRIIDIHEARRKKKMHTHFSQPLVDTIQETLNNKEQIILFQNRRGFSPYIECTDCGRIPVCKNCDVSLTYHKKRNQLRCHYCGFTIPNPSQCPDCGSHSLQTRGFGTEKIEDEIRILFPDARVSRLDLDTARSRKTYERIITDFEDCKVDILIGTQMISKGLDFDHVRIVGILNADNMLNFPDFRSFERSFQLISQVSGRAGRKGTQGTVFIQTSNPGHVVIQYFLKNDYKGFMKHQLHERQAFKYPPFYRLVKLTLRHKNFEILNRAARHLADELRKDLGERIVGPEFPLITRLFTFHQKCILVKLERDQQFSARRKIIQNAVDHVLTNSNFKGLHSIADVDPYS